MKTVEHVYSTASHRSCVALVTGAAGFIGSHLVERLLREGHYVIGVDCFTDYYPGSMKKLNMSKFLKHDRFEFIKADLLALNLEALLKGNLPEAQQSPKSKAKCHNARVLPVDYVFHLAAQPGVRASWGESFEIYTRNNILVTQRLLEAAKNVQLKKLVYASSSSVYGDAETLPTTEDMTPKPVSPYGVTKLAAEHLCLLYWRNYDLPVVCLRYFTVYGPRQRPDMAFYRFIKAISERREIVVYGDGEQTRDFTYVDDVVNATVLASAANLTGEILNVGGGSRVTINECIRTLENILGKQAMLKYTKNQAGDVRHTAADITRARSALGFKPKTPLIEGLRAECQWIEGGTQYKKLRIK